MHNNVQQCPLFRVEDDFYLDTSIHPKSDPLTTKKHLQTPQKHLKIGRRRRGAMTGNIVQYIAQ